MTSTKNDIAVVGMAGRFPMAKDVDEFWRNLREGKECISFFSDEELIQDGVPAEALTDAGCTVHDIPAPDDMGAEAHALARTILSVSLTEWLAALQITDDQVPPLVAALAAEGRATPATVLFAATGRMARLSDRARMMFASADAVLFPVLSSKPPPLGAFDLSQTDTSAHFARMEAFAPNAALANVAGLPALALPCGMADGLPLGVQLWGPIGADLALCRLAALIEARTPALNYPHPIAGMSA